MSLTEVMVESLHHLIDQLTGIFVALLGEVEIEHSGFELGMAHVALDDAQIDAGFEEVGGVGMAQRVYGNSLFSDAGIKLGVTEGALDTTFSHGSLSLRCPLAASAEGGEEKTGMAVGEPVTAQELKGGLGQREVAILGALTTVEDRKSTRLNSSHDQISYAVFCLKKNNSRQRPSKSRRPHPA